MKNRLPVSGPIAGALLLALSAAADAQQGVPDAEGSRLAITDTPAWLVKPRVSMTETFTDNVNVGNGSSGKQGDQITEIAPGIRIDAKTARLKGYFDYSLNQQIYAQHSSYGRSQNSLNTASTLEAVDNWLFVDFSGVIAQQSISALGVQSPSTTSVNSNSTETSTYRMSPYIRGRIGGATEYSLRYSATTTRSASTSANNVELDQWTGQLRGSTPFQKLKWSLDANQQTTDYSNGRKTDADTIRAMGTYSVLPDLRVSGSGGSESNNYSSLNSETHATHGYGFDWTPTERTKLALFKERRFFGDGHTFTFTHRFPQSSISYTDTKDVSALPNQSATTPQSAGYQQIEQLCTALITSTGSSDPNALPKCLALFGFNTGGFLTSQATLQRRQQLSLALQGVRNSLTLMVNRGESQSLSTMSGYLDPLTQSAVIQQQGLSVNLSHRLSELSSLNLLGSRQQSTSSGSATGSSDLKTTSTIYQLGLTTKLGAKSSGSLNARHSSSDGNSAATYSENAIIGALSFSY